MSLFPPFFTDKCPICNKALEAKKSSFFSAIVIKACPENHFQKEFHPALETYIESSKIS